MAKKLEYDLKDSTDEISKRVKDLLIERYIILKTHLEKQNAKFKMSKNQKLLELKAIIRLSRMKRSNITNLLKEQLASKSWSIRRLESVFPNFQIKFNNHHNDEDKNK